jgi:hypothetical protein
MSMLSRRSLLSALLALASIAVAPSRANGAAKAMVVEDVKSWVAGDALLVGQRYLQLQGAEANLDVLADLLLERLHSTTSSDLQHDFSLAVQEDFGRGDVVHLDGWMLSRTEVRLCALAHLAERETGALACE